MGHSMPPAVFQDKVGTVRESQLPIWSRLSVQKAPCCLAVGLPCSAALQGGPVHICFWLTSRQQEVLPLAPMGSHLLRGKHPRPPKKQQQRVQRQKLRTKIAPNGLCFYAQSSLLPPYFYRCWSLYKNKKLFSAVKKSYSSTLKQTCQIYKLQITWQHVCIALSNEGRKTLGGMANSPIKKVAVEPMVTSCFRAKKNLCQQELTQTVEICPHGCPTGSWAVIQYTSA